MPPPPTTPRPARRVRTAAPTRTPTGRRLGSSLLGGGVVRGANAPRRSGRTAGIVLAALVVFGALYGVLHNRLAARGTTDPAINGVRTVVAPFATGTSRTNRSVRTFWDYVFPGKQTADAVTQLSKENDALKLQNETLRNAETDANRLREQLGFNQKQKKPLLPAEIIALLPSANAETVSVGRGTRQGVKVGSVARTADGLLGQVTEVGSDTAQVLLLSDTSAGVGVLVQRRVPKTDTMRDKADAVVHGGGRGKPLEVLYLPRDTDVLPGDTVITSGYGGTFPAGIPIGRITEIVTEDTGFFKKARVEPFAPMPGNTPRSFFDIISVAKGNTRMSAVLEIPDELAAHIALRPDGKDIALSLLEKEFDEGTGEVDDDLIQCLQIGLEQANRGATVTIDEAMARVRAALNEEK